MKPGDGWWVTITATIIVVVLYFFLRDRGG